MNLVELDGATVEGSEDFFSRVRAASFVATLQAGYTNFHYLRPVWRITTEEDALIGVGITGIGAGKINEEWLDEGAWIVVATNEDVAGRIGVNVAARTTTIKPSGTSSLVLGSSSGIHAYHNDYYIRRMRFGKDEAIWKYLSETLPELCEDEFFRPHTQGVFSIPQRSPQGAILRTEHPLELLKRVKAYNLLWVKEGHVRGDNNNNVSVTVSLKDDEWEGVGEWMWDNRHTYNGISVLPYDGGSYIQAPFEDVSEERYNELIKYVHSIDLKNVIEYTDNTSLTDQAACAGDGCVVV